MINDLCRRYQHHSRYSYPRLALSGCFKKLLDESSRNGLIIICDIVYAELALQFPGIDDLDTFLLDTGIELVPMSKETLKVAAQKWSIYNAARKKSASIQCSSCGKELFIACNQCGNRIAVKQHILSDFIIGSHALKNADLLLTRDRGYYRTYFPELKTSSYKSIS